MKEKRSCTFGGCEEPETAKGLCRRHYYLQWSKKPKTKSHNRPRACSFPGCEEPHNAKGLCKGHRQQQRKGEVLTPIAPRKAKSFCSFEGCKEPQKAKGLCRRHYQQQKEGRPLTLPRSGSETCTEEGCKERPRAKGLCKKHYLQRRSHRLSKPPRVKPLRNKPPRVKPRRKQKSHTFKKRLRPINTESCEADYEYMQSKLLEGRGELYADFDDGWTALGGHLSDMCESAEDTAIRAYLLPAVVRGVIASLTPREERVIRMRFGIGEKEMTLEEVGKEFGVTRERIREIEVKAIRKLRHPSHGWKLRHFYPGKVSNRVYRCYNDELDLHP